MSLGKFILGQQGERTKRVGTDSAMRWEKNSQKMGVASEDVKLQVKRSEYKY